MKLTKFNSLPGANPAEKIVKWAGDSRIYVQFKYNGVSFYWDEHEKAAFTRGKKRWEVGRFPWQLYKYLMELPRPLSIFGELILPGESLSKIAGAFNVNSDVPFPQETQLVIFDVRDPRVMFYEQPLTTRLNWLNELPDNPHIKVALTWIIDASKADRYFGEAVNMAYEGVVYRRYPCFLTADDTPLSDSSKCHPDIVKRKKLYQTEGICIEVTEGKGKRKTMLGAMILQLHNGRSLRVGGGAGLDDALLTKLWHNPPLNKQVTFSYEEMGPAGIPLRPQFVAVRDYE